jgi:hypothetical protein
LQKKRLIKLLFLVEKIDKHNIQSTEIESRC